MIGPIPDPLMVDDDHILVHLRVRSQVGEARLVPREQVVEGHAPVHTRGGSRAQDERLATIRLYSPGLETQD